MPPLRLKNIHYYIMSGKYSWAGELLIANGNIYYFPLRDLEEERNKTIKPSGLLGYIIHHIILQIKNSIHKNKSYLEENNLFNQDDDEYAVSEKVGQHLTALKRRKDDLIFSYSDDSANSKLPPPMRFEIKNIKNISLSFNKFRFETVADSHDFKINRTQMAEIKKYLD